MIDSKAVRVHEIGRDDLRSRAKRMLHRNGWKPGNQFSGHSVVELMVSLAIDAVQSPPDRCGYPECRCCHDASCSEAALSATSPAAEIAETVGERAAFVAGWWASRAEIALDKHDKAHQDGLAEQDWQDYLRAMTSPSALSANGGK